MTQYDRTIILQFPHPKYAKYNPSSFPEGALWGVFCDSKLSAILIFCNIFHRVLTGRTRLWLYFLVEVTREITFQKNIERHTAHTIVSWPNPKQWLIVHTSDLMMTIRQSIYILSIITREMGILKTHSPTYGITGNLESMLNLTHTLDKIYI